MARAPGCSHKVVAILFDTNRRLTAPRRSHKLQPDEVGASVRAIVLPHAKSPVAVLQLLAAASWGWP